MEFVGKVPGELAQATHAETGHRERGRAESVAILPQQRGGAMHDCIGEEAAAIGYKPAFSILDDGYWVSSMRVELRKDLIFSLLDSLLASLSAASAQSTSLM